MSLDTTINVAINDTYAAIYNACLLHNYTQQR